MAFTSLDSSFQTSLKWKATEPHPLSITSDEQTAKFGSTLTFGSGDGQGNIVWHGTITDSISSFSALPRTILGVGGDYSFDTIKHVRIVNSQTSSASLSIPALGLSSAIIPANSSMSIASPTGWAVAGTTVTVGGALEFVFIGVGAGEA